jgi:hypothetical protein
LFITLGHVENILYIQERGAQFILDWDYCFLKTGGETMTEALRSMRKYEIARVTNGSRVDLDLMSGLVRDVCKARVDWEFPDTESVANLFVFDEKERDVCEEYLRSLTKSGHTFVVFPALDLNERSTPRRGTVATNVTVARDIVSTLRGMSPKGSRSVPRLIVVSGKMNGSDNSQPPFSREECVVSNLVVEVRTSHGC